MSLLCTVDGLKEIVETSMQLRDYFPEEAQMCEDLLKCEKVKERLGELDTEAVKVAYPEILNFMRGTSTSFQFENGNDVRVAVVYGLRLCGLSCEEIINKISGKQGGRCLQSVHRNSLLKNLSKPNFYVEEELTKYINFFCPERKDK